ncbi:nitrogen assimilation response regulator NtrX [Paracoccus xiamenensis]|uniref:nitrogen assimilation response regulator NtrX n=1 Tax=Paracoccus xiamenensis TaxID=2714901 RepID=UPI00140E19F5|nr:sigma-54 dependent transcriptional regulator [Paracoccus xiamenensis]NHF74724.1 sigma-54-dependent Fis family transcriptional regulator [Paracoccus xiamenensis]
MSDILIVDDERDIRELIADILQDEGFQTRTAANSDEAIGALNDAEPSLMILDIWLKDSRMDGIDILKQVKRNNPDVPVIIISGHGNIEIAVAAIKQGAYDFIEKPFNIDQLMVVLNRAMETNRLRRENAQLKRGEVKAAEMLGGSAAFKRMRDQLDKLSKSNGRVMLTGEPGAGKELAARYIHSQSPRAHAPFIIVPCATIEPERMEEVLFGRESADRGIEPGLLEQAHGGSIYFDEVADMPLGTQPKILRVLTEQQFARAGGSDKVRVDLRVISSTNRDLPAEIAAGRFRQELYDRLNVVPLAVPSLADRREDIPMLSAYFMAQVHEEQGLPTRDLSEESAAALQAMDWPGNIRQLRNVIERVLILAEDNGPIRPSELQGQGAPQGEGADTLTLGPRITSLPLREARELFEREYLLNQINRFGGNISRTAQFVGMERSALHRKLKSLGVVGGRAIDEEDE